jgi:hypothetical protein
MNSSTAFRTSSNFQESKAETTHDWTRLMGDTTCNLEWRALSRALQASTDEERREAAADAVLFRAERYRLFPGAQAQEQALELNEGLAEYTGVRVGNPTPHW